MDFTDVRRKSEKIIERLVDSDIFNQSCNVFGYINFKNEVDVFSIKDIVKRRGYRFMIPRALKDKQMSFSPFCDERHLKMSSYGILEPKEGSEVVTPEIGDLILVPGCCFDLQGYRIGYGAGYYDQYLEAYPKVIKVGVAFENQLEQHLPKEPHDIPMNYILTENRLIKFNNV
jgi:5-formyltetrahydrofolate cyclo-ligase